MHKGWSYALVFALGLGVSFLLLKGYSAWAHTNDTVAKQNVLRLLNQPASSVPIADNPFVLAANRITPAVVNIDTVGTRTESAQNLFGQTMVQGFEFQGKGSGVIISADGYVVTNNHVIDNASIIRVTTSDDKKYDARLVGADANADLAILKIDSTNLPTADLGDSKDLKIGEYVIAIGNPLGVGTTVTHGIISAVNRRNLPVGEGRVLAQALQTDAPINKGNSGGALANMNGQLIGINTAIASSDKGGGNIGIGFAIPINAARSILKSLIEKGRALPPEGPGAPFLGIRFLPLNETAATDLHVTPGQGVVVESVEPLTGAADAGLKRGDVLIEINHQPILKADDVRTELAKHKVGEEITVKTVNGDSVRKEITILLRRRPADIK